MNTLEPTNWLKDLKTLGPMGAITAICVLLVLIITGIIPTPLMQGLTTIDHILTKQTINVLKVICENTAKNQDELAKCFKAVSSI